MSQLTSRLFLRPTAFRSTLDATASTDTSSVSVLGGVAIAKRLVVGNGLKVESGSVTVPTPTNSTDAATKGYVDSAVSYSAGTGLTVTNRVFSVNAAQPQITSVGTLTSLDVSGTILASSAPTIGGHLTNKTYVDSLAYIAAGTGLTKSSGTLSVNSTQTFIDLTVSGTATVPTPVNATDACSKGYVDSEISSGTILAGTGLTKSGTTLSINASQTQITSVGTLNGLSSSGIVSITNTTAATSASSGALQVAGGIGGTTAYFSGAITASTSPSAGSHLTNKTYVDALAYLTAGTGLIKTAGTLSVDSEQTQITSVGTLSDLTVSGNVTASAAPNAGGHLTNKLYVDSLAYLTAGTGLTKSGGTLSVNAAQTQITSLGTLSDLTVSGNVTANTSPSSGGHLTNKTYVDALSYLTAGTGLSKSGGILTINAAQTQITSVGTLSALTVSGTTIVPTPTGSSEAANKGYVDTVAQGLDAKPSVKAASTGNVTVSAIVVGFVLDGVTLASGNRVLLKDQTNGVENGIYVVQPSGAPVRAADMAAGSSASGSFFFVENGTVNRSNGWVVTNTSPDDIVGSDALFLSQFSGAGQITDGAGLTKSGNMLSVNVDSVSIETVNDTLRIASGAVGTGLSGGSGTPISVNAAQTQITSVGTLTSLTSSGVVSITNANESTSASTGALQVAGGIGVSGHVFSANAPSLGGHLSNKTYVDGLTYLTTGTGLSKSGSTLSVGAVQTQITSLGTLTGLTSSGNVSITSTADSTSVTTGGLQLAGGAGITKSLSVGGVQRIFATDGLAQLQLLPTSASAARIFMWNKSAHAWVFGQPSGTNNDFVITLNSGASYFDCFKVTTDANVVIPSVTDSTSIASGALQIAGGVGITKSVYVGENITSNSLIVSQSATGPSVPISIYSPSLATSSFCAMQIGVAGSNNQSGRLTFNYVGAGSANNYLSIGLWGASGGLAVYGTGIVSALITLDSTSATSGALQVAGGVGIAKALFVGSTVTASTAPSNGAHLTNKTYVDSIAYITAGAGISKSGNTLSVDTSTITSVGTLNGLTSTGVVTITNTTESTSIGTGALLVSGGVGIAKDLFVGGASSSFVQNVNFGSTRAHNFSSTSGTWINVKSSTITDNSTEDKTNFIGSYFGQTTINQDTPDIVFTGKGSTIYVAGAPIAGTNSHINNPYSVYVASGKSGFSGIVPITDGDYNLGENSARWSTVCAFNLSVNNSTPTSGVSEMGIFLSTSLLPEAGNVNRTETYFGNDLRNFNSGVLTFNYLAEESNTNTMGFGLYNAPNLLTISGTGIVTIANTTDASLQLAGGMSMNGDLFVLGNATVSELPTSSDHVANKLYVDALEYFEAGTGLSKIGTVIFTSETQDHVTSVGTLTSLTVSGTTTITNTANSTSAATGALQVAGGIGVGGFVTSGIAPTIGGHLTNKTYVDGLSYVTAGTGLSKSGATLSVNAAQTQITSVGTLTSLTSSGLVAVANTTDSSTISSGALQVSGGVGIAKNLSVGGVQRITATDGSGQLHLVPSTAGTTRIYMWNKGSYAWLCGQPTAVDNDYVITLNSGASYFDCLRVTTEASIVIPSVTNATSTTTGALQMAGGAGIAGNLFVGGSVNASSTIISNAGATTTIPLQVFSPSLTAGSFTALQFGVAGSLFQSARLTFNYAGASSGLNYLSLGLWGAQEGLHIIASGIAVFPTTLDSTSSTSGAVQVSGGLGIAKSLNVGNNATIGGSLNVTGAVTSSTVPASGPHLTNKTYVDGLAYLTAGTGLTKTSNTLSVNAAQTQITSIGTLTALTVSGTTIVPTPVGVSEAATKGYVDTVAQGLDTKPSVKVASTSNVALSAVVVGLVMDGVTLAAGNRVLLKNQTNGVENGIYVVQASGAPIRSADMASGSAVSGSFFFVENGTVNKSNGWVITNSPPNDIVGTDALLFTQFSGAGQIVDGVGLSKSGNELSVNVDAVSIEITNDALRIASGALGTGLSGGSGTAISVNAAQSQITSVGTLTGLTSSGIVSITNTTDSSTITSGALQLSGGIGIAKGLTVGGIQRIISNDGFAQLQLTPSTAGAARFFMWNKGSHAWICGQPSSSDNDFVLTLNSGASYFDCLRVTTGASIIIPAVTNATSTTTGALQMAGGAGIAGNVFVGGTITTSSMTVTGAVTASTVPSSGDHLTNKTYVDGLSYVTAGTGLSKSGATLSINAAQTQITSVGTLTGLTSSGIISVTNASGSTSTTTGALQVTGGVGIQGSMFVGGSTTITGALSASSLTISTAGAGPHVPIQFFTPSLATSSFSTMQFGVAGSTNQAARLYFNYVSAGSASNTVSLGLWGSPHGLSVDGSGITYIPVTTDSTNFTSGSLQVAGGVGISKTLVVNKILTGTGGIKLRFDTAATNMDYTITYNNSGDNLHVHLAGTGDSASNRLYQFGYYTSDQVGTWNSKASINTYNGNISTLGSLTAEGKIFAGSNTAAGDGKVNIEDISGTAVSFYNTTTKVGSITLTGSTTSYNTTSDYRLKENVVPLTDACTRIKNLPVRRFNFIGQTDVVDGFIAHELAQVIPEAVTGEKDAVYEDGKIKAQAVDQSKVVPLLTAALKEAIEKIERLNERISALENV